MTHRLRRLRLRAPPAPGAQGTRLRRRRFAVSLAPLAAALMFVGALLADGRGWLGTLGFLILMQGVGLLAAIIPLAFGHNPLSKD